MKTRQFLMVLGVVALVAVIYSPSTIGVSGDPGGDGGTGPADTSPSGTSTFLSDLRASGYKVVVANTSQQVLGSLGGTQKKVYLLIGADTVLSNPEVQAVQAGYRTGTVSILIAEGNATNKALLSTLGASASGSPITDPLSQFKDPRVFVVTLSLGSSNTSGVIDIASPLSINSSSTLHPVASTSALSRDGLNGTEGPRTVVAAGASSGGARAIVLTDSAPFTNFLSNFTQTQGGVDEKAFVSSMVAWVDPTKATLVMDAAHYNPPQSPKYHFGIPIGPLVAYALEQNLGGLNSYYDSFPSQVSGFLGGMGIHVSPTLAGTILAAIVLFSVYGALTRWFAPEKRGKDDQPPPGVEKTIVAESAARLDFLQTSRSKSFYIATLAQLYEVMESIVVDEFGKGLSSVGEGELASKVGAEGAMKAKQLFLNLSKLHEYATGKRRLLFPPVLRWRALVSRMTLESEEFLNQLGITIAGQEEAAERQSARKERVEYLMRARVRA